MSSSNVFPTPSCYSHFIFVFISHYSWSHYLFSLVVGAPCPWHIWLAWPSVTQTSGKHLCCWKQCINHPSLTTDNTTQACCLTTLNLKKNLIQNLSHLWYQDPVNCAGRLLAGCSCHVCVQFYHACSHFHTHLLHLHSWDRKNNPEPWNKLGPNDQYKVWD